MNLKSEKGNIQESRYRFPYHHIPYMDEQGYPHRIRILKWGYEYLCYQYHIKELIETLKPSSILDIGCGDGYFLGILSNRIAKKVGVDLSERAIKFAQAMNNDITYLNMDASEINDVYDIITAIEVLEHIPDSKVSEFIQILSDRVKKSGYVIISVPTTNIPLNAKHYRHYTFNLLKEQLANAKSTLKIVKHDYIYRNDFLMRKYFKLTQNRLWFFEPHILRKYMWKYTWNKLRIANQNNGYHLIVLLKKY